MKEYDFAPLNWCNNKKRKFNLTQYIKRNKWGLFVTATGVANVISFIHLGYFDIDFNVLIPFSVFGLLLLWE